MLSHISQLPRLPSLGCLVRLWCFDVTSKQAGGTKAPRHAEKLSVSPWRLAASVHSRMGMHLCIVSAKSCTHLPWLTGSKYWPCWKRKVVRARCGLMICVLSAVTIFSSFSTSTWFSCEHQAGPSMHIRGNQLAWQSACAVSERTWSISFCLVSFCSRRLGLSGRTCGARKGLVLSMDGREAAILARRSRCSF